MKNCEIRNAHCFKSRSLGATITQQEATHTLFPSGLAGPSVLWIRMTQILHWLHGRVCSSLLRGRAGRGQVRTTGTLTSNHQPDFCRGIAQLIDGSAGVDASIPLLDGRDPKRPGAGGFGGQDHLKPPWTKDEKALGRCPQLPREARGQAAFPSLGSCNSSRLGPGGQVSGGRLPPPKNIQNTKCYVSSIVSVHFSGVKYVCCAILTTIPAQSFSISPN